MCRQIVSRILFCACVRICGGSIPRAWTVMAKPPRRAGLAAVRSPAACLSLSCGPAFSPAVCTARCSAVCQSGEKCSFNFHLSFQNLRTVYSSVNYVCPLLIFCQVAMQGTNVVK